MSSEVVAAVVLAGERGPGPLAEATGAAARALVPVAGRPMLCWVLDALEAAECVGPVCVIGPASLELECSGAAFVAQGGSLVENLRRGAQHFRDRPSVMVCSADVPLLTPEAVDDFVRRSLGSNGDVCYAIVPQERCVTQFPEMRRTYARLRDGVFTGGNLFYVRAATIFAVERLLERAFAARKNPLLVAGLVGPAIGARFLCRRRLSIAQAERHVGRLLGAQAHAIITHYAEIGADVDKADDLAAVEKRLSSRPAS